jgi:3D (Asp-Asp-Asp) domain-containing protein/chromosome segregation ATPase
VRGRPSARALRSVSIVLATVTALLTAAGASAEDPSSLRSQADRLEAENASLAAQERSAVLELYALETKLARADRRVESLRSAAAELERERGEAERRLDLVRANLTAAQMNLAHRLRRLYMQGDPDPLELLLGAGSLDEVLTALDNLGHVASQDKEIVEQVRVSRAAVEAALDELERRSNELAALVSEAEAAREAVGAAQAERADFVARLREQRSLNRAEISDLLSAAEAAENTTTEIEAPAPSPAGSDSSAPSPPSSTPSGGRKLTVEATGYAIHGSTATGIPTGWGVVAVDPSVIPLGTRMYVPGYGEGVAADTGSAVKGNIIDLWFPTREQALQWGRRTVTITLY